MLVVLSGCLLILQHKVDMSVRLFLTLLFRLDMGRMLPVRVVAELIQVRRPRM
jgi:hypothetical protein